MDSESGESVEGAAIGGSLFAGDVETSFRDPTGVSGSAVITSDADGRFAVTFLSLEFGEVCGLPPFDRTIRDPEFPAPTRIELIVVRGGCETTHVIEVNEDTVVDLSFPNDTLEFRDPILVPPCEAAD